MINAAEYKFVCSDKFGLELHKFDVQILEHTLK